MSGIAEVIAAIAALVAAVMALVVQRNVSKGQEKLEQRQTLIDENTRIVNDMGKAIPIGDEGAWNEYQSLRARGKSRCDASKEAQGL